ncbi:MAG: CRISPR-associated helicase Cas3' [Planctomycetes bacterium]|nr:CRISPR-associated helicase Cas3' [Planctomycetota bacterium]
MPESKRLLAKSLPKDRQKTQRGESLPGHTAEVLAAARTLLAAIAEASLAAARLPSDLRPRLERLVLMAAFLHDLGKCSDHFQAAVRRGSRQLVRHEALSAWLAWSEPLNPWLRAAIGNDLPLAIAAAAGHHRKFDHRAQAVGEIAAGLGSRVRCLCGHVDFERTLALAPTEFAWGTTPTCSDYELRVLSDQRGDLWPVLRDLRVAVGEQLQRDQLAAPLLALAKAIVLTADVAGSALPKAGESTAWIAEALSQRAGGEALGGIAAKKLDSRPARSFQNAVAASDAPLTLVRAGCGSGKTVAAYLWAARHHGGRQIWVCYPTTGTTTEGFRDYLQEVPDLDTRVEHSRATIDLKLLGVQGDDDEAAREVDRLEALRVWGDDVIACTCDTVLGLMQNQRKGLYAWPGLCRSAVVFDEIHAYDDRLFGCLLAFLRHLPGLPCLLMTASLPASRHAELNRLMREVHKQPLPVIDGPEDLETLLRYCRTRETPQAAIARTLAAGGKVLWVRNTVNRCLAAADAVPVAWQPEVYHSRFRYEDRVARHRAVIDAFRKDGPALAITTQVAEMSLDLSADLLVSDLAPIPALIQRLGRLNRRADPAFPPPPGAFVVEDFVGKPYNRTDLDDARAWLERLGDAPVSQRDLVRHWQEEGATLDAKSPSNWWNGGASTEPAECRDGGPGITVLLAEDAAHVTRKPTTAGRYAIPMLEPRHLRWRDWKQVAHHPVAKPEFIHYEPQRGARWLP